MEVDFSQDELQAIEVHKYHLSQREGHDVGIEYAAQDWLRYHAKQWRMQHMMAMERKAIEVYKWLESEKAQRDLGAEAVFEWINKYAAQWRQWYEQEYCRVEA